MRDSLAIVLAILTIGLASRPMLGQTPAVYSPPPETIDMIDTQYGWAVLLDYHSGVSMLVRTTDGASNWRDVTPQRGSGQKIDVFRVNSLSSNVAWVMEGGIHASTGIFRTIDGGRTWKGAAIAAPSVTSISFINPREGWLIAFLAAFTGGKEFVDIYRSLDGGETWIKVVPYTGLPYGVKTSITFLSSTTGWITVLDPTGTQPYLYVTRDGGRTWRPQNMPLPRELMPRWEARPEPPRFFTAREGTIPVLYDILNDSGERSGKEVVLYATHDGGTTWTYTAPVLVNMTEVVYQAVADVNHAWVLNGGVLRTTSDGGRRWMAMPPNQLFDVDVKQLDFISPQTGWAIRRTFPFLLKTLDGGRTWTPVPITILRE